MSVPLEYRINAQLLAWGPLVALVGARVDFVQATQETAVPYVEFSLIGIPFQYTHDGPEEEGDTLVQFDSYGKDADESRAVNRAVLAALGSGESPLIGLYFLIENDGTDFGQDEMRRYRVMAQARAWYRG